ncbi:MAG: hypothetical protein ACYTFA_13820 [Planctomycetota bacterium]
MNSKDMTIGILSTTAVILLVGIMIIHSRPEPALASGMTVSGGRYVMSVGSVSIDDEELVFVIDSTEQKMLVYRFDTRRGQLQINQRYSLKELSEAASEQPKPTDKKSKKKKRGRRP